MSSQHQAMPQLYGAPSYARPPRYREPQRPFTVDDLPIEAHRTAADDELLSQLTPTWLDEADVSPQPASLIRRALPLRPRNG